MTPNDYCKNKALRPGTSFSYSLLFAQPAQRDALVALQAFCRELADVTAQPGDPSVAARKLDWWREEVARLAQAAPNHPVTRALQPHLTPDGADLPLLLAVIEGREMDLTQTRYLHSADLDRYCKRVSGSAARLSARLLGVEAPAGGAAEWLGMGVQLASILRNVGWHAREGRIYLPVNTLQQFDVPAADILNGVHSPRFVQLMAFQAQRVTETFDRALALLTPPERRTHLPLLILATICRVLLEEIRHSDFQVLHQRIALTPIRKFWIACKTRLQ